MKWTVVAFHHQQSRNRSSALSPLKDLKHHRWQHQMGLRSDFPFPLHLAGKLPLEGSWWQQHTHQAGGMSWWTQIPTPPSSEAALTGSQRSKERGGRGMKSRGIQGIHSHPVPQGWGVAAYPPNSGHVLSSPQPEFSFKEPKMLRDNTCSKVSEPACSVLNKEIILLLPPEKSWVN